MRKYNALRVRMLEMDVGGKELGRLLKLSVASVSHRMTGRESWKLDEAYAIMDYLGLPHEQLAQYFPANGTPAH